MSALLLTTALIADCWSRQMVAEDRKTSLACLSESETARSLTTCPFWSSGQAQHTKTRHRDEDSLVETLRHWAARVHFNKGTERLRLDASCGESSAEICLLIGWSSCAAVEYLFGGGFHLSPDITLFPPPPPHLTPQRGVQSTC